MNIFLIIFSSIGAIILSGLVYFMYKARKGTLNLSTKSWHYKLLHLMWNVEEQDLHNACPYYWALVVSIIIIPFYLIVKLLLLIGKIWPDRLTYKGIQPITISIPETKKQWSSLIWKHSKTVLTWIWYIIVVISLISFIVWAFWVYIEFWISNWSIAAIITSIVIGTLIAALLFIHVLNNEEYDEYFKTPFCNLFIALYYFIMIIPNLLWLGIKWIFGIIGDMCPAIEWNKTN